MSYRPSESKIRAVFIKFRTKFTLLDIETLYRMRILRTEENIRVKKFEYVMQIRCFSRFLK